MITAILIVLCLPLLVQIACCLALWSNQEQDAPTEVHPAAIEAATDAVQEKFEAVMTPRRRKSLRRQATLEKGLSERRKLEEWRD